MNHEQSRPAVDVVDRRDGMTLREKAGQMALVEWGSIRPDEAAAAGVGAILSGGGGNPGDGSARAWRDHVESYVNASCDSRLGVPILYGTDAVHGHNNVEGATIFPHNIGLGAAGDAALVEAVARASALETAATGARWSFAPCLAVPQDPRWGRVYEGFSQDTEVVSALGAAAVRGWHGPDLAGSGVAACAKHFVGEGAMEWGSAGPHRHPWIEWWDGWGPDWKIDQGDVILDESELRARHLEPFRAAIEAGALTVMAGYGSWQGQRIHGHRYLLSEVLKGELSFDGFVVSDWLAVDQLDADYSVAVAMAVNAGVDMVMVPFDHARFIDCVVDAVQSGAIPVSRIDDAVDRILRVKAALGLFADTSTSVPLDVVGCDDHRALARSAVRASVVVLENRGALPVAATSVFAAGLALDDIGIACGGWTISWEGAAGPITSGRTILDGLRRAQAFDVGYAPDATFEGRAEVGIVSVHELPYVEGGGDRADLSIDEAQLDIVRRLRTHVDRLVVVVVSGRPLLLGPITEIADAIVACWLPGSEADAVADVLVGAVEPTGRLPICWPRSAEDLRSGRTEGTTAWPIGHAAVGAEQGSTR